MFTVFIKSAGGTKRYLAGFYTELEAELFCNDHNWEYKDENEFVWDMDYEENFVEQHERLQHLENNAY